jgi:hypothetical protein
MTRQTIVSAFMLPPDMEKATGSPGARGVLEHRNCGPLTERTAAHRHEDRTIYCANNR